MVAIKSHDRKESPLVITFQRYHWSSDELAWSRFLTARDFDLDSSKAMIKQQQLWRKENLPVDRLDPGIVRVLNSGGGEVRVCGRGGILLHSCCFCAR